MADAAEYVSATIAPTLNRGLVELCRTKPEDPRTWLAHWLMALPNPVVSEGGLTEEMHCVIIS